MQATCLRGASGYILVADADTAKTLGERLRQAIDRRNSADGQRFQLSFSTGVALYDGHSDDTVLEALLHEADLKMYKNKRSK